MIFIPSCPFSKEPNQMRLERVINGIDIIRGKRMWSVVRKEVDML
jgi:hypothetical protein